MYVLHITEMHAVEKSAKSFRMESPVLYTRARGGRLIPDMPTNLTRLDDSSH